MSISNLVIIESEDEYFESCEQSEDEYVESCEQGEDEYVESRDLRAKTSTSMSSLAIRAKMSMSSLAFGERRRVCRVLQFWDYNIIRCCDALVSEAIRRIVHCRFYCHL